MLTRCKKVLMCEAGVTNVDNSIPAVAETRLDRMQLVGCGVVVSLMSEQNKYLQYLAYTQSV